MTAGTGSSASETPTHRAKVLRIAAGITAGAASLALTLLLTTAPERVGLSSSPELFESVRAEDRASDAFIFAWALIAIPVAGLLQTPLALARRARIGPGWALIAGYWLYVVLMAAVAWQIQGYFPAADAPGRNGGLIGAAILLMLATPLFVVASGGVFREVRGGPDKTLSTQIRDQITAVTVLCCTFTGLVAGLTIGRNFTYPRDGFPAMFLPGGALWGLLAGAALGHPHHLTPPPLRRQPPHDDRQREVVRPHIRDLAGVLPVRIPAGLAPAGLGGRPGRPSDAVRPVGTGGSWAAAGAVGGVEADRGTEGSSVLSTFAHAKAYSLSHRLCRTPPQVPITTARPKTVARKPVFELRSTSVVGLATPAGSYRTRSLSPASAQSPHPWPSESERESSRPPTIRRSQWLVLALSLRTTTVSAHSPRSAKAT